MIYCNSLFQGTVHSFRVQGKSRRQEMKIDNHITSSVCGRKQQVHICFAVSSQIAPDPCLGNRATHKDTVSMFSHPSYCNGEKAPLDMPTGRPGLDKRLHSLCLPSQVSLNRVRLVNDPAQRGFWEKESGLSQFGRDTDFYLSIWELSLLNLIVLLKPNTSHCI